MISNYRQLYKEVGNKMHEVYGGGGGVGITFLPPKECGGCVMFRIQ